MVPAACLQPGVTGTARECNARCRSRPEIGSETFDSRDIAAKCPAIRTTPASPRPARSRRVGRRPPARRAPAKIVRSALLSLHIDCAINNRDSTAQATSWLAALLYSAHHSPERPRPGMTYRLLQTTQMRSIKINSRVSEHTLMTPEPAGDGRLSDIGAPAAAQML